MESIVIWIAELLGAKLFKKYWPVDGSYWNRAKNLKRLDPTNKFDLERTIYQSYEYTQTHIQGLTITSIVILPVYIFVSGKKVEVIYTYFGLLGIHLYALLIHQYNRILARRRLKNIPSEPVVEAPVIPFTKEEYDPYELRIIGLGNDSWYRLGFKYSRNGLPIYLNPYFTSKKDAGTYKKMLEEKVQHIEDPRERASFLIM